MAVHICRFCGHALRETFVDLGEMPLALSGHAGKEAYYAEFGGILRDLEEKMKDP